MASPQPNRFTKVSNELFDIYIKISRFLSPYENTIWLCILRKTYGFNKTKDWISLSQIEEITGIRQPHVARTKKKLLLKNMIISKDGHIGIQKDYDTWNIPKRVYLNRYIPKQALPKQVIKHTQTGNQPLPKQVIRGLPKQVDTKETITKDTLTKDNTTKEICKGSKEPCLTNQVFDYFCLKYKEVRNKNYIASFAKDKKILKDLLNIIPIEDLKKLMDIFLNTPNSFCEGAGYTIGVFKTRINSLRTEDLTLKVSDKTIKSIIAVQNWIKKKEAINVKSQ